MVKRTPGKQAPGRQAPGKQAPGKQAPGKQAPVARTVAKTASRRRGGVRRPPEKNQFLDTFRREHATTVRVLRALPPGQGGFRPHERSQSARDLAFTFTMEQKLISLAIQDQLKLGGGMPKAPDDYDAIVDQFEKDFADLVALIERTSEAQLYTTVKFPVGPGTMGDFTKLAFAWFMLFDQIHHRGQFTVMLRMAGGKVPSIYGPSGDEPWF